MNFLNNKIVRIVVAILGGISLIVIIFSLIFNNGEVISNSETLLINAAKRYFENNNTLLPKEDYDTHTVSQNVLINQNYLKTQKDNNDNTIFCSSYVTVVKTPSGYIYNPYIKCNMENDTKLLYEYLTKNVVTKGDGIYKIGEDYYFRGDNPNNYVLFSDKLWRVTKIYNNKNIKMISNFNSSMTGVWDDRFNTDVNAKQGINDYSISRIATTLLNFFHSDINFSDSDRSKIAFTDVCIGKRSKDDKSIDGTTECSSTISNQPISLLQMNEYFIASTDSNCPAINFVSCQNYNFLSKKIFWTITGLNENTHQVFVAHSSKGAIIEKAHYYTNILPTIVLKNDVGISSGEGTMKNPYVIK